MSVFRFVFVCLLAAVAAAAFASCGGDGKKSGLLAAGEYQFTVSGTLELEFPAETASALPIGARQNQDTDISGDVKLKMNDDGSFEFEGWGIKATVKEGDGGTADLDLKDSPEEPSTGMTDKNGTDVDIYWQANLTNREERSGTNDSTIGGSSPDPLGPNIDDIEIDVDNPPNVFADRDGKILFVVNGGKIILTREQIEQTPQAQPTTPAPQPTTPAPQPTTPSPQVETVRVEQKPGCQHPKPDDPPEEQGKSDAFDLILIYLKQRFPVTPTPGNYLPSGEPARVVMSVGGGSALLAAAKPPLGEDEEPLAGATVNVSLEGPGVLDAQKSGTTDENGELRVEMGINKFGTYKLIVGSVRDASGKFYVIDPESQLNVPLEVGPVCNPPEGW